MSHQTIDAREKDTSSDTDPAAPNAGKFTKCSGQSTEANIVIGGGGARVLPSGAGFISALERAQVHVSTFGGVSGGYLVAVLFASGTSGKRLARLAVETNFQKLLTLRSLTGLFRAQVMRKVNERLLPAEGVFGTARLSDWFDERVPAIPENCWTIGVHGNHGSEYDLRPYLFTGAGTFEQHDDFTYQRIAAAARPGVVACITSAIPGILEPVQFNCESRSLLLFDGMLTPEGRCPIIPIIHHYKKDKCSIIAFDVGPERGSWMTWLQDRAYEYWCKRCYREVAAVNFAENHEVTVVRAKITGIASTQFRVTELPKLNAYVDGYVSTMRTLVEECGYDRALLDDALRIAAELDAIRKRVRVDKNVWFWQRTRRATQQIKEFLAREGLYELDPQ